MARSIRTLLYTIVMSVICINSSGCGAPEPPDITKPGSGTEPGPFLAMEVYRLGTDLRSIYGEVNDEIAIAGSGGVLIARSHASGRFVPLTTGIANDLNFVSFSWSNITLVGEGLTPDDPGIIRRSERDDPDWINDDHPALGGFLDFNANAGVTTRGELILGVPGARFLAFEDPGGSSFDGVTATNAYVTAVGSGGRIYRNETAMDFSTWVNENIVGGPDFQDVVAAQNLDDSFRHIAYAAGGREIWRRVDGVWERAFGSAAGDLYGLSQDSDYDSVWAVGANGTILHYDGSDWQQTALGSDATLRAINDLGTMACGDKGVIYEWDEIAGWTNLGYTNVSPWNDIDGISANEVYAANRDTLMGWDGAAWGPVATHFNKITSVYAVSSDRIWLTSLSADGFDSFVYHWDGATLQFDTHSSLDPFNSVWCDAPGDTILVAANNGYVFRYGGVAWDQLTADPARKHFYDLDGTSAHDIFAVGQDGLIAHFNGTDWTLKDSGVADTLRAICGNVAVGDNGTVTRWNGVVWRAEDSGTMAHLNAVCVVGGQEAWAVGDGSVIISSDGDGNWTQYERSLYTIDLNAVWGAGPDDVWFGGETGYLLRHQP